MGGHYRLPTPQQQAVHDNAMEVPRVKGPTRLENDAMLTKTCEPQGSVSPSGDGVCALLLT